MQQTAPERLPQSGLALRAQKFVGSVFLGSLLLSCTGEDRVLGPTPLTTVPAPDSAALVTVVTSYTESFTGVAAALSGSWTQQRSSGTINKTGGGRGIGSVGDKDLFAYWSANTFGNDQYSQVRITGGLASRAQYVQITVRATGRGDTGYNNYLFYTDGVAGDGHTEVAKNINGTQITIRSFPTTFAAGDVIKIGAVGTTITCYKNGVAIGTITDASLTGGSPGVGVYGNTVTVDDWEGGSSVEVAVPVASVTVSPVKTPMVVGEHQTLTATLKDANDNSLTDRTVTWVSSNPAVLTVSPVGLTATVTAVGQGSATVTATSESVSSSPPQSITVNPIPVASVTVNPASASVVVGGTRQLAAVTKDANGVVLTGRAVTWSSDNAAVTVDANGLVTAVSPGSATVTATSEGASGTSAITVTLVPVAAVAVSPSSVSLTAGSNQQLTAILTDAGNNVLTGRSIAWTSSNVAIASVDPSSGVVTAMSSGGPVTITATSEGKTGTSTVTVSPAAGGTGPLRVSARNPRYFENAAGQIVYLTGSHTWSNLQDNGTSNPPATFNYGQFLDFLVARGHNFTRLWTWEQSKWTAEIAADYWITPAPFRRMGPDLAQDGKPKFDLNQFDPTYFDRLRSRVQDARARGIYVSVMLFNGWSIGTKGTHALNNPWKGHPLNAANNVNGINGDIDADGLGFEIQTLTNPALTAIEEAYVRRVIDAVSDLDNVLYEVDCEGDPSSRDWQYHMIQIIRDYEATKGVRHPIGMTPMWPNGTDSDLYASGADWIAVTGSIDNPTVANGSKVVIADTDHICGICGNVAWVWRSFTRGQNPILMDGYDGAAIGLGAIDYSAGDPVWEAIRKNLGYARSFAVRMNLAAAVPRGDLASTGYALAVVGSEYLAFLPSGGSVRLNLAGVTGSRVVEWLNPANGRTTIGAPVTGGTNVTLRAPFSGSAVVYVHP